MLLGNYGNYALLTSYVEQMLNCTSMNNTSTERPKCSEKLVPKNLAQRHRQSAGVESLVKLVFGLGRAISEVNSLTGDLWFVYNIFPGIFGSIQISYNEHSNLSKNNEKSTKKICLIHFLPYVYFPFNYKCYFEWFERSVSNSGS